DFHVTGVQTCALPISLRAERMIHLGKGSSIRQSLAAYTAVDTLQSFLEVDHLATVTGLILAGMGVSLVPGMTLFHFRHQDLRIRSEERRVGKGGGLMR